MVGSVKSDNTESSSEHYVDEESQNTGDPLFIEEEFETTRTNYGRVKGDDASVGSNTQRNRRRMAMIAGFVVCLLLVATAIIVPTAVVLTRKNKDDNNYQNEAEYIQGPVPYPYPNPTTAPQVNDTNKEDEEDEGSDEIPQEEEEASEEEEDDEEEDPGVPVPFEDVDLPGFSEDILAGYASREELRADLTKAAKHMVNMIITSNIHNQDHRHNDYYGGYDYAEGGGEVAVTPAESGESNSTAANSESDAVVDMVATEATTTTAAKNANEPNSKVEKANANDGEEDEEEDENKEKEADFIARDEKYIYAAYGDYVLVWDNQGNSITQVKIPGGKTDPWGYTPKAYINALFLTDDNLFVITQRHNHRPYYHRERRPSVVGQDTITEVRVYAKPADTGMNKEMSLIGTKSMIGYYHYGVLMPGGGGESEEVLQIVTSTYLNMYFGELDVYHFPWTTKEGYVKAAAELANTTVIPRFVDDIMDTLFPDDGSTLPNIMKLNTWGTETAPARNHHHHYHNTFSTFTQITSINVHNLINDEEGSDVAPRKSTSRPIRREPQGPTTEDNEEGDEEVGMNLKVTGAALFGPHVSSCYGSDSSLIMSLGTSYWEEETERNNETLYLVALKPEEDGSTAEDEEPKMNFHSLAQLEGRLSVYPRQGNIDIEGNDLRIATSIQRWYGWDVAYKTCGDIFYFEDMCMNPDNWVNCTKAAWECSGKVVKAGGCPYTSFTCEEDAESASATENFVIVFDLGEEPGEMMKELGRVNVGNTNELITSVHFDESRGYVTTFDNNPDPYVHMHHHHMMMNGDDGNQQTLPDTPKKKESFYTLDLPSGQAPVLRSDIVFDDGTRNSLRPLELLGDDEGKTLLLGIGRNISGYGHTVPPEVWGMSTWGLISVLDVSDPEDPEVLASRMLDLKFGNNMNTYSDAEWDPKAATLDDDGILIIQVNLYPMYHHHHYYDDHYVAEGEGVAHDEDFHEREEDMKEEVEMEMVAAEEGENEVAPTVSPSAEYTKMPADTIGTPPPGMPMPMTPQEEFRGFIVYDLSSVAEQGIVERFRINHVRRTRTASGERERICRYCDGHFQGSRSYTFNDNKLLVTVNGDYVIGTDLKTGEELWSITPGTSINGESKDCCW